jgi:hypothetical protein
LADPAQRAAYLTEACGGDAELRRRVEAMLRDTTAAELALQRLAGTNLVELSWTNTAGFILQRADSLAPTSAWAAGSFVSTRLTNGIRSVTVSNAVPNRFFRLFKP